MIDSNKARQPKPIKNNHPLVKELFAIIDMHPTLNRSMAFKKAGYHYSKPSKISSGEYNPNLSTFTDVAQAMGYELVLKPINEPLPMDIHRETAALFFDVPYNEVTKEQRDFMKARMFGLMYDIHPSKLKEFDDARQEIRRPSTQHPSPRLVKDG